MSKYTYNAKQKKIIDTAMKVFLTMGLESMTLEEIAERLGYTKQAIYYYYRSKEDLVAALCKKILLEVKETIITALQDETRPEEQIRIALNVFISNVDNQRCYFQLYNDLNQIKLQIKSEATKQEIDSLLSEIPALFEEIISRGIKEGSFKDTDVKTTAKIFFGMIGGVLLYMNALNDFAYINDAVKTLADTLKK